ncbi:hypothetical protein D3C85_970100 [compost metagenome]
MITRVSDLQISQNAQNLEIISILLTFLFGTYLGLINGQRALEKWGSILTAFYGLMLGATGLTLLSTGMLFFNNITVFFGIGLLGIGTTFIELYICLEAHSLSAKYARNITLKIRASNSSGFVGGIIIGQIAKFYDIPLIEHLLTAAALLILAGIFVAPNLSKSLDCHKKIEFFFSINEKDSAYGINCLPQVLLYTASCIAAFALCG